MGLRIPLPIGGPLRRLRPLMKIFLRPPRIFIPPLFDENGSLFRDENDGFEGLRKLGLMPFSRSNFAISLDFFRIGIISMASSSGNNRLQKYHKKDVRDEHFDTYHNSSATLGSISCPSRPIFTGLPSFHGLCK